LFGKNRSSSNYFFFQAEQMNNLVTHPHALIFFPKLALLSENICTTSFFTSIERNSLSTLIKAKIYFKTIESEELIAKSSRMI